MPGFVKLGDAVRAWQPGSGSKADPLSALAAAWPGIVGDQVAQHTRPADLNGETLLIVTRSSAWSQQLAFLVEAILSAIVTLTPGTPVTRLRFRIGRVRSSPRPPRSSELRHRERSRDERPPLPADATPVDVLARFRATVTSQRAQRSAACPSCGAITEGDACAPCAGAEATRRADAIARILYDAPWLGYEGTLVLLPGLRRSDYDRVRADLLTRWWEMLRRAKFAKRLSPGGMERRIASSYVLLQSGLPPDRLTPPIVNNLLGVELAALLLRAESAPPSAKFSRDE